MESQQHTTQRELTCTNCKTLYLAKRYIDPTRRYCNKACKQQAHRDKQVSTKAKKKADRIEDQLVRWYKSTHGKWIIRTCRDVGTLGILLGHTTSSLFDLKDFSDRYYKCYGYDADEKKSIYNRCHVQASKGRDGSVGLLHPSNLFIGAQELNKRYSNKLVSLDAGQKLPATRLKRSWKVERSETDEAIARRIAKFLGREFTEYLSQSAAIVMNEVNTLAKRIHDRQDQGTAAQALDRSYTREVLERCSLEELRQMDAHQRGGRVSTFKPENYTRAALCVYADELERIANVSPSERQRNNCRFMLNLIRVLGMFVAQMQIPQGVEHSSFLSLRYLKWQPLEYRRWQQPWGRPSKSLIDTDQQFLITNLTEHCFHALAGADVPQELLQARLFKRLDVATLAPTVQVPAECRFKALGSWDAYIAALSAEAEKVWQALLELGMCDAGEVATARTGLLTALQGAITTGRARYRNQDCFKRTVRGKGYTGWGFKGYPAHLEYPPAIAPGADATTRAA
jgi:hypothetical protein